MILQNFTLRNPKNPLIYVIDSNDSYRKIIRSCLLALNYRNISLFKSTGECLVENNSPDIVILDNNLGPDRISGLEFFRIYRKRFEKSQFLFLSSNSDLEVAVNAMKLGAYDYIIKSKMGLEQLIERVDKLINVYRRDLKRRKFHRIALLSIGLFSLIFIFAIILYIK